MNVIYKTIPRHTEENIPLDQIIEIYFMIDIHKHSLRQENIILFNITEQIVEPISFEYQRRILKIRPTQKLKPNNHYQLQIVGGESGIKDITGRIMAQTYEVEFYTKDIENIKPPILFSPTDVSVIREPATFRFQPIEKAHYYELQISKSNTFHNLVWPTNGEKIYQASELSVTPNMSYETGTYYARIRSVDENGIASSWSSVIQFYYDGAPIIQEPEDIVIASKEEDIPSKDTGVSQRQVILKPMTQLQSKPSQLSALQKVFSAEMTNTFANLYVKSVTPKDKSVNNALANAKQIVIEFTENIDPQTINHTTCYVLAERN